MGKFSTSASVTLWSSVREMDLYLRSCRVLALEIRSDRPWVRTGLLSCLCTSSTEERQCLAFPRSSWGSEETCTPAGTADAMTFGHQVWHSRCLEISATSSKWRSIKQEHAKMMWHPHWWSMPINCRSIIYGTIWHYIIVASVEMQEWSFKLKSCFWYTLINVNLS